MCERESVRDWTINFNSIEFDYEVLPLLYQKRNAKTTTSDVIINKGFSKCFYADVVVLFGYNYLTYLIVVLVRKILGKKTILFSESTGSDKVRKKSFEKIKAFFIKNFFYSYIVPGQEAMNFIQSHGVDVGRISVAENAVEPFSEAVKSNKSDECINILYVGRLAEEKNIDFLIKNIPTHTELKYRLVIVGTGPQIEELKAIPVDYPLVFTGFKEGNDLASIFSQSDIFVLPSNSEPWGLVINEAINMGLAPIVSDKVGCRHELVKNNGAIFKLNDSKDFQDKLFKISYKLKFSEKESMRIASEVTIDKQAFKIYKAVLDE